MTNYDFKCLNDKEFESLCADLLGKELGVYIERFKAGKDGGVDGRFFTLKNKETILQCKHWATTPTKQLIAELKRKELPKLEKLKPERYLLAVSNPLSRSDKSLIAQEFRPYIKSPSDIFGCDDVNALITKHSDIEQRHHKLWLHSAQALNHIINAGTLGYSDHYFNEITENAKFFAYTENYDNALKMLESLGVLLITGEPGIGKTTLANQLCLHYATKQYNFIKVSENIREAENLFDKSSCQLFYFDDFLGRNYLEALSGHEGSHITQFMRRIAANKQNKRFILTSRSTILNQGKHLIDSFELNNINKNEFELKIQSLSELDKGHILYNHIWHSLLSEQHIDEIYDKKRYKLIVRHKNYNPRTISHITDHNRIDNIAATEYWMYIWKALENPAAIWDNAFSVQQDDYGRLLVTLVVFNGRTISETNLLKAYSRALSFQKSASFRGRSDFQNNIKLLCGSLLSRTIKSNDEVTIDLFNPSIGDYVLNRFKSDTDKIRLAAVCLQSKQSLHVIDSIKCNAWFSSIDFLSIISSLVDEQISLMSKSNGYGIYCLTLLRMYFEINEESYRRDKRVRELITLGMDDRSLTTSDSYISVYNAAYFGHISHLVAIEYVASTMSNVYQDNEILYAGKILSLAAEHGENTTKKLTS